VRHSAHPPCPVGRYRARLFGGGGSGEITLAIQEMFMRIFKVVVLITSALVATASIAAQSEIPIPRSVAGDKGKYFLLEKQKSGSIVRALHKRVGVDSIGYTLTETNCATMQMRELGYSEQSPSAIKENPTKWFDLVPGSSKSDLANFVCR
jgi:hypothetical protein